jgi:hypothetical protein
VLIISYLISICRGEQAMTSGYRFLRRLTLKPGFYHARIGIREEGTDRMGTAAAWIEVSEVTPNKLAMSSLILRNPLDLGPVVDREGINVSDLEQIRIVQGVPLYAHGDFCDYFFRIHHCAIIIVNNCHIWMGILNTPIAQK